MIRAVTADPLIPRPLLLASVPHADRQRPRGTLVDKAYRTLKARILDNEMPPGQQTLEHELAALLGMSRTPVREALVRLAEEGLVEVQPRRGVRVLPVSPDDMREIYELLTCLESTAAELLAARCLPAEAPALAELEGATLAMEQALARDDLDCWAAADERYHIALLDHCGNRRLARMAFAVWDQSHRARLVTLRLRPKPTRSTSEHVAVTEAIRRHDPDAARRLHRQHRLAGMRVLLDLLTNYRLKSL
jgi:DNA-binding GntR family transcriptional regulator